MLRSTTRLVLSLLVLWIAAARAQDETESFQCPFDYERHSFEQIEEGKARPWLWVGADRMQTRGYCACAASQLVVYYFYFAMLRAGQP